MGYTNARAQDRGFVHINTDGSIGYDNLKSSRGIQECIESLDLSIADDPNGRVAMQQKPQSQQTAEQRAIASLNKRGHWSQLDLDDEMERKIYQ